jgi:hypothetical protein
MLAPRRYMCRHTALQAVHVPPCCLPASHRGLTARLTEASDFVYHGRVMPDPLWSSELFENKPAQLNVLLHVYTASPVIKGTPKDLLSAEHEEQAFPLGDSLSMLTKSNDHQRRSNSAEHRSINFDGCVDLADKEIASIETNGASQAEEAVRHDEHVAKVHQHGDCLCDVKLGEEVEQ